MSSDKTFLNYLIKVIFFSFALLLLIASINFKIDPTNVYIKYSKSSKKEADSLNSFIEKLVNSNNGILMKNYVWNERDIYLNLAKYNNDAECIILGSSQIIQISSLRKNKSLTNTCDSLVNLGVSGAVLEDYIVLSQSILENQKGPKKIIIAINAWTLNFNRDSRWLHYKNDYDRALKKIITGNENMDKTISTTASYEILLIKNLINIKYFISSLNLINSKKNYSIELAKDFNYELGTTHRVLLSDGSIISSAKDIKSRKNNNEELFNKKKWGMQNWGIIPEKWYDENAIEIFIKLVNQLKNNFNVIFLITPYHPYVWSNEKQPAVKAMRNVELKINEIAKMVQVDVVGSFNPEKVGCDRDEFIDEIHATDLCLSKLEKVYVSN
jgi:hypothetical protein